MYCRKGRGWQLEEHWSVMGRVTNGGWVGSCGWKKNRVLGRLGIIMGGRVECDGNDREWQLQEAW